MVSLEITICVEPDNDIYLSDLETIYTAMTDISIFEKDIDNKYINLYEYSKDYNFWLDIIYTDNKHRNLQGCQHIMIQNNMGSYFYGLITSNHILDNKHYIDSHVKLLRYTTNNNKFYLDLLLTMKTSTNYINRKN